MDPALIPAKEVLLKRNTDCIYFLASPLTCKKGTKCEFRHSESARFNLKDCYYWLNGNCLNPKCAFRHPPLDGLLGHASVSSQPPSSNKQSSLCIYFQRGNCLKAEKCPFTHVEHQSILRNAANQSIPRNAAKASPSIFENKEAVNKESSNMKQCAVTQHKVSKRVNGFSQLKNLPPKSSQKHQTRTNVQPSVKEVKNGLEPGEAANRCYSKLGAHFSHTLNGQIHNGYKKHVTTVYYEENDVEQNGKVHGYHERKPQRREVERRNTSVGDMCLSDLRQRSKQRKLGCSDTARCQVSREGSRSSRLNGRISVPRKEKEISRNRGRSSPTRRYGKEPPFSANSRNVRSRLSKRDAPDYVNFSGPKSLAELKEKKTKVVENSRVEIIKEVSHEETVGHCPTFEGPKPLSMLLKRKRREHEIDQIDGKEEAEDKVDDNVPEKEDTFVNTQNNVENREGETLVKEDGFEEEEGDFMDIDGVEDEHLENFEGDYELNGDDNGEEKDEDDKFARKIGLVFS